MWPSRSDAGTAAFDAILLDVDNGPAAMATASNAGLYDRGRAGPVARLTQAGGILAVWSARDESRFERTLRAAGFEIRREHVRARTNKRGARHTILVASPIGAIE